MRETEFFFTSFDKQHEVRALLWEADEGASSDASDDPAASSSSSSSSVYPRGIVQILHGMAEHIERYRGFAEYCISRGFIVCGLDHVGHGKSVEGPHKHGVVPSNGDIVFVEDAHQLRLLMQERFATTGTLGAASSSTAEPLELPYFMLGHSMGSFVLRNYLATYAGGVKAAVLCGTGHPSPLLSSAGSCIARILSALKGPEYRSPFLHNLSVGAYSQQIDNARTPQDWLSTDDSIVDEYIAAADCGYMFSTSGNIALTALTKTMVQSKTAEALPRDFPLLFIAGSDDPVGEKGASVKKAVDLYKNTGHKNVTLILYENKRHEVLNETNKEQVYSDVTDWLLEHRED